MSLILSTYLRLFNFEILVFCKFCFVFHSLAASVGDPHIVTLDGAGFTFNGLGEYVLMETNTFSLQARTSLLPEGQNATYFSSLVGRQVSPLSDTIELRMNDSRDGLGTVEIYYYANSSYFNLCNKKFKKELFKITLIFLFNFYINSSICQ